MKAFLLSLLAVGLALTSTACHAENKPMNPELPPLKADANHARLVMGGGCFWCLEAVFQRLDGVQKVVSGYAGGKNPHPTYREVCEGDTGHAEIVAIDYDPAKLPLPKLLEVFWAAHDPTTLNRQGNDVGTQYRSVLYFANDEEKAVIEKSRAAAQKEFPQPIVTEVSPLPAVYVAEDYHQNYYNQNADRNPYCALIISPKLRKLIKEGMIKEE